MPYDHKGSPRYEQLIGALKFFNGSPRFYELLAEMACLHADKNHDYAGNENPLANFKECERYGISAIDGVITRISDKDSRFMNWARQRRRGIEPDLKIADEKIVDTLLDRAVYTLILILLVEEEGAKSRSQQLAEIVASVATRKPI